MDMLTEKEPLMFDVKSLNDNVGIRTYMDICTTSRSD